MRSSGVRCCQYDNGDFNSGTAIDVGLSIEMKRKVDTLIVQCVVILPNLDIIKVLTLPRTTNTTWRFICGRLDDTITIRCQV